MKLIYKEEPPARADKYLSDLIKESRNHIKNLIDAGNLKINGKAAKPSAILAQNDIIDFNYEKKPVLKETIPQKIAINILYEDDYLAVINKVSGITVHPAAGNFQDTLANALAYKYKDLPGDAFRPGIAHRLDKETSGAIIIAKEEKTLKELNAMFKAREIKKEYAALVFGNINSGKLTIDAPIGRSKNFRKKMTISAEGKPSFSEVNVKEVFKEFSYVGVFPLTGRTHQIRAHLKYINHPVVGDKLYAGGLTEKCEKKYGIELRLMLHSYSVEFIHPAYNKKIKITAPFHKNFKDILTLLKKPFK